MVACWSTEVFDLGNPEPRLLRSRWTDEGERGFYLGPGYLVARLTTRWDSRDGRNGKAIWTGQRLVPPTE